MANLETSVVWKHFVRDSRESATCKLCKKELKCKGSSTTGLRRHLLSIHNFNHKSMKIEPGSESPSNVEENKKLVASTTNNILNSKIARERGISTESFNFSIQEQYPLDTIQSPDKEDRSKRDVLVKLIDTHKEKDEDALFFESFLPTIKRLSLQEKMQFKMEFQHLLYKYIFKEEHDII